MLSQKFLFIVQTPPRSSPPVLSGVLVNRSLVLYVCFVNPCLSCCPFFFWSLLCLSFFDLWILITPLVSSTSSSSLACSFVVLNTRNNITYHCFSIIIRFAMQPSRLTKLAVCDLWCVCVSASQYKK